MSPIARLTGVVAERGPDWLIVDVNGVGYLVYGPAGTVAAARVGADVALHTPLAVREDGMTLYGFASADERRLFQTLTAVSGVGPKAALALLSVMPADDLSYAIGFGSNGRLKKLAEPLLTRARRRFQRTGQDVRMFSSLGMLFTRATIIIPKVTCMRECM